MGVTRTRIVLKNCKSYSCIDYFMCAGLVGISSQSIGIEPTCLLFKFNDHYPIGGYFSIPPSCSGGSSPARRKLPYDVKRVGEPAADAAFLGFLSDSPPIPLTVEPSTHCHLLDSVVVRAASRAYPFLPSWKETQGVAVRHHCSVHLRT